MFILKAFKLLDLNISPPENAEQDRDGCDQREQRGDAGGQGPHLEESLFWAEALFLIQQEQAGLPNNPFFLS